MCKDVDLGELGRKLVVQQSVTCDWNRMLRVDLDRGQSPSHVVMATDARFDHEATMLCERTRLGLQVVCFLGILRWPCNLWAVARDLVAVAL